MLRAAPSPHETASTSCTVACDEARRDEGPTGVGRDRDSDRRVCALCAVVYGRWGGAAHPCAVGGGANAEGLRGRRLRYAAVGDARVEQHAHVGGPEEEVEVDGEGDEVDVGVRQLRAEEGEDRGRVVDDGRHLGEHRGQHLLRREHVLRRAALVQQRLHAVLRAAAAGLVSRARADDTRPRRSRAPCGAAGGRARVCCVKGAASGVSSALNTAWATGGHGGGRRVRRGQNPRLNKPEGPVRANCMCIAQGCLCTHGRVWRGTASGAQSLCGSVKGLHSHWGWVQT